MDTGGHGAAPAPASHGRLSDRATSALAAVSVFLVLLFLFWRFIWQALKHRDGGGPTTTTTTTATTSAPPPSSCPAFAGETAARRTTTKSPPLPVLVRVAAAGSTAGAEKVVDCAVCLAELADGEPAVRLVPGCGHGFHAECIEAWFRVNSTCPLCRAAVDSAGQSAGEAPHYCSSV